MRKRNLFADDKQSVLDSQQRILRVRENGAQDQLAGLRALPWALGVTIICVLPLILIAAGIDFSSDSASLTFDQTAGLTTTELNDSVHFSLCGSFTHTLLEWTAVCAAFFVCLMALVQFKMTHEPSLPVIGIALVCAGAMDAFHTLAADRLISAVADNHDLIPFTWAICRLFNALILLIGVGIFSFSARKKIGEWSMGLIAISEVRLGSRRTFTGIVRDLTESKKLQT